MNLFEALAWLNAHPGVELAITKRNSLCSKFKARMVGRPEFDFNGEWEIWAPDLSRAADYSATVPKRKLPTPPVGFEWRETEHGLRLSDIDTQHGYYQLDNDSSLAAAKNLRAIHTALIEEYETRPK